MSNNKTLKLAAGNLSANDAERAILPAIIYMKATGSGAVGRAWGIGWWKWGVRVVYLHNPAGRRK